MRPTRLVRARVVETPKDYPENPFSWAVFSLDSAAGRTYYIRAIHQAGAFWSAGPPDSPEAPARLDGPRRFETRLPAGRFRVRIRSATLERLVDFVVPYGEATLDLPDIHVESLAWVKMMGKPAAELDATDIEGKPVELADYRGKVVLLHFWSTRHDRWGPSMDRLADLHARFKDQPLVILATHAASTTSIAEFKTAVAPLLDRHFKGSEPPFRLLLDQPPIGDGTGP